MANDKTILVVDDKPFIVNLIKNKLETHNYNIITAFDGDEAVEKATKYHPDLIILDILMPKMDGISAADEIRSHKEISTTPIIFLTEIISELQKKAYDQEIGGIYFIAKPFKEKEFLALIEKILG